MIAALGIVLAMLMLQDVHASGGMPDQDQAVEVCVLHGLIQGARNTGLPINAEDGHGREYDHLADLCRRDPTRFNVEAAAPNGKEANP